MPKRNGRRRPRGRAAPGGTKETGPDAAAIEPIGVNGAEPAAPEDVPAAPADPHAAPPPGADGADAQPQALRRPGSPLRRAIAGFREARAVAAAPSLPAATTSAPPPRPGDAADVMRVGLALRRDLDQALRGAAAGLRDGLHQSAARIEAEMRAQLLARLDAFAHGLEERMLMLSRAMELTTARLEALESRMQDGREGVPPAGVPQPAHAGEDTGRAGVEALTARVTAVESALEELATLAAAGADQLAALAERTDGRRDSSGAEPAGALLDAFRADLRDEVARTAAKLREDAARAEEELLGEIARRDADAAERREAWQRSHAEDLDALRRETQAIREQAADAIGRVAGVLRNELRSSAGEVAELRESMAALESGQRERETAVAWVLEDLSSKTSEASAAAAALGPRLDALVSRVDSIERTRAKAPEPATAGAVAAVERQLAEVTARLEETSSLVQEAARRDDEQVREREALNREIAELRAELPRSSAELREGVAAAVGPLDERASGLRAELETRIRRIEQSLEDHRSTPEAADPSALRSEIRGAVDEAARLRADVTAALERLVPAVQAERQAVHRALDEAIASLRAEMHEALAAGPAAAGPPGAPSRAEVEALAAGLDDVRQAMRKILRHLGQLTGRSAGARPEPPASPEP